MNAYKITEIHSYHNYLKSILGEPQDSLEVIFEEKTIRFHVFSPDDDHPAYRLVSQGMFVGQTRCYEVVIELPEWWDIDDFKHTNQEDMAPLNETIRAALSVKSQPELMQEGYVYSNDSFIARDWVFAAVLFTQSNVLKSCELDDRTIDIYHANFLFEEEFEFYDEIVTNVDHEIFIERIRVMDPNRPSIIAEMIKELEFEDESDDDEDESVIDFYAWHMATAEKTKAMKDPSNAASHITLFMKWCMIHNMMSEAFDESFGDMLSEFTPDTPAKRYREFVLAELNGLILREYFNELGQDFVDYYYGDNEYPNYPHDVDLYAFKYHGDARYHEEFDTEAYLSFDLDEQYEFGMFQLIQKRYDAWIRTKDLKRSIDTPDAVTMAFREYLSCECTYFAPTIDDDVIGAAYEYALIDSKPQGYIPVLIQVNEHLWETVVRMHGHGSDTTFDFNAKEVSQYRESMLSQTIEGGQNHVMFDPEVLNDFTFGEGEAHEVFISYWDYETEKTYPLILAKIPVQNPWEIFAYLPFGGWNACPDTEELMRVSRYWFETYGAQPAVISASECEFILPAPVKKDLAKQCAVEQYLFCSDLDQSVESIGVLADMISKSKVWYFWWD